MTDKNHIGYSYNNWLVINCHNFGNWNSSVILKCTWMVSSHDLTLYCGSQSQTVSARFEPVTLWWSGRIYDHYIKHCFHEISPAHWFREETRSAPHLTPQTGVPLYNTGDNKGVYVHIRVCREGRGLFRYMGGVVNETMTGASRQIHKLFLFRLLLNERGFLYLYIEFCGRHPA